MSAWAGRIAAIEACNPPAHEVHLEGDRGVLRSRVDGSGRLFVQYFNDIRLTEPLTAALSSSPSQTRTSASSTSKAKVIRELTRDPAPYTPPTRLPSPETSVSDVRDTTKRTGRDLDPRWRISPETVFEMRHSTALPHLRGDPR